MRHESGHETRNACRKEAKEKNMNGLIRRNNNLMLNDIFAPVHVFEDFFNEMFEDGLFKPSRWAKEGNQYPMNVVSVKKDGKTVAKRIEYALAGFGKDDIKVSHRNGVLTIEAEHDDKQGEDETTEYNGISYKKMTMSYSLPDNADEKAITSRFKDGLLSVTIPFADNNKKEDDSTFIEIE